MARLEVFRLDNGAIALDCQSDYLAHLSSRFTAPLLSPDLVPERITGLHPSFEIGGETMVMATHLAGAIPARALHRKIGKLTGSDEYEVQRALDTLSGSY